MPNPELIEETPVPLSDVKDQIEKIETRDKELNYRSNKTKEYLNTFQPLSKEKKDELQKKLEGLDLVRLKPAHIVKIIDFLPTTAEELKVLLQAYPATLPKKDIDGILAAVKEIK